MTQIRKYKISSGVIDASGNASAYSIAIRGQILAIGVNYPTNTCTVDVDSNGEAADQKILDLAAANTDRIIYPRTSSQDITGADVTFDGTNEIYEPFVVYGRLKLSIASGTAGESVSINVIVRED